MIGVDKKLIFNENNEVKEFDGNKPVSLDFKKVTNFI
jgi:hypothetical protein